MRLEGFEDVDVWKALILYGLNAATYKIALGKTLLDFVRQNIDLVNWEELSKAFFYQYFNRINSTGMPQQGNPGRLTVMERIVKDFSQERISEAEAIELVGKKAFNDVLPRFHSIGNITNAAENAFYVYERNKKLVLKDSLFNINEHNEIELEQELNARWDLLEGAFLITQEQWDLTNDLRDIYLSKGYERKNITCNIPFLQGYQGNVCFYCGEPINASDIHVDHVLPRQILLHDEIWNLVLSHGICNSSKNDNLVALHFIEKLIARNENIIGSNHPWKAKIIAALGVTPINRRKKLLWHYENTKKILGGRYWKGVENYNPELDPFYRKLVTKLNNE